MWKKPSTFVNNISILNTTSETKGSDISSTSNLVNSPSVVSNSNKSSTIIDGSNNQYNNNISHINKNVKLLSINNDMQTVENNTIDFSIKKLKSELRNFDKVIMK